MLWGIYSIEHGFLLSFYGFSAYTDDGIIGKEPHTMTAIKPYHRIHAVEYARTWALSRNPLFSRFDAFGGDCTNFISQCIFAGSCVMNETPTFGWYYRAQGDYAPAWTGVPFLYNFLIDNCKWSSYIWINNGIFTQLFWQNYIFLNSDENLYSFSGCIFNYIYQFPYCIIVIINRSRQINDYR